MEVLKDLVARDRRDESTALRAAESGRSYDYRRFCTTAWKVGNLLRHHGVRRGAAVVIADDPAPEPVLTLYGAACLGAVVQFGQRPDAADAPSAIVGPSAALNHDAVTPATEQVAYGDAPADPSVGYFDRDVWSENPASPPDAVDPGDLLLETDCDAYTHHRVLDAAASTVERHGIGPDTTVAIAPAASFTRPGVVVAGLVGPILGGGTVAVGPGADGDVIVGGPDADVTASAWLGER
jgi:hypothetical protein